MSIKPRRAFGDVHDIARPFGDRGAFRDHSTRMILVGLRC